MRLLFIVLLLLAGCATTPQEVMKTEPVVIDSPKPPRLAAKCVMDNAENWSGGFNARFEDAGTDGEIHFQVREVEFGSFAIGKAQSKGSGSRLTIWFNDQILWRQLTIEKFTSGC